MPTIINPLPNTFVNGTTIDATQVNADFNQIVANVNANGAANGANSDITALNALSTPIPVTEGGTARNALAANGIIFGNGTSAVNIGAAPGNWTPTDASGAGLAFSGITARIYQLGAAVLATFQLTYPVTASGAPAALGGLAPFTSASGTLIAGFVNLGPAVALGSLQIQSSSTNMLIVNGNASVLNSALSGVTISGTIIYLIA